MLAVQRHLRAQQDDLKKRIESAEAVAAEARDYAMVGANRMRHKDAINADANLLGIKWKRVEEIHQALSEVDKRDALKRLLVSDSTGDQVHFVKNVLEMCLDKDELLGYIFIGKNPT